MITVLRLFCDCFETDLARFYDEVMGAGLLHPATRVIFHDFTIYSGTKDAYVNVRLVLGQYEIRRFTLQSVVFSMKFTTFRLLWA